MPRGVFVFIISIATALWAQSTNLYQITHTYALGGDGSWDYVVLIRPVTASTSPPDSGDGCRPR